ncbi:helix-turn-helix domain-containing protein [Labilibaculum sp.]|uniref:helix-turn-helix domain-containing protein n=1 Tax=Labilibaculum sp. TaxID=2060723 RepID=UPI0035692831
MTEEKSMDEVFLKRLHLIVEKNLKNEQFGVQKLAEEMGMSRSQIHRKLQKLTHQSISRFIRKIRLKKAMLLLQKNVATVSEISYEVGFRSPTYFNKCFHEFYGFPPGEVKKRGFESSLEEKQSKTVKTSIVSNKRTLLLFSAILILFGFSYFFLSQMSDSASWFRKAELEKSIAILPFKNLSADQSNVYFTDGIMEDILNRLSLVNDLKVISRASSNYYRESTKTLAEIGKELGVSYLVTGSIQKSDENVRIFVKLIVAKEDNLIWSGKYDANFKNLFTLQSDLAKQIASELKTVLSPKEIQQIEIKPPKNQEAYHNYLKGRFFWNKRTEIDVEKSLNYFERSIEQDSTYALAYAGVADAYLVLAWWKWYPKEDGYAKSKEFALKALALDPSLAEPHATLAVIAENSWKWAEAERGFKRAIELNKNYATAHYYYAEFLGAVGKINQAVEEINIAIELDPLIAILYNFGGVYHYQAGLDHQALNLHQTALDLGPELRFSHIDIFYIYLQQGKNAEACEELKKYLAKNPQDKLEIPSLESAFKRLGRKGMLQCLINIQEKKKVPEAYFIAELYAKLDNKEKALEWLEKAFATKEGILFIRIKNDRNLKNLHNEPRYRSILQKIGLDKV